MSAPTFAQWLADPNRTENLLIDVTGYDTVLLAEVTLRFSSLNYATEPGDTPANLLYDRRIVGPYERVTSPVGGDGGARFLAGFFPTRTGAIIRLKQFHGDLDLGTAACLAGTPMRSISFGGRSIVVRRGGTCSKGVLPFSEYQILNSGTIDGEPGIGLSDVTFRVKDKGDRLKFPVQDRLLFGTDRCVIFNGTTTGIDCGTNAAFDFTSGAFSLTGQVYKESFPTTEEVILCRGSVTVDGWALRLSTSGALKLQTYQSGAVQTTTSNPVPLDRAFEYQVTRTGSAVRIFIDGVDETASAGVHINPTSNPARHLYIGRSDSGSARFEGALDEIRIRGAATTEEEFEERMHRPLDAGEFGDYLGYWDCNDGDGSFATLDNKGTLGSAADGAVTDGFCAASCMGPLSLAGRPMPSVWGSYKFFSPICVDAGRQIWLIHSAQSQEITRARIGGRDGYVDGVDYDGTAGNSWLAFIIGTTADGAIDRCTSPGWTLIRRGNASAGKFTIDGDGDKADGTYRNTVGSIIRRVVTTYGQQPFDDATEVDDTAFDAFEAAHPETVNYTFTDNRDVETMVTDLAKTKNAALFLRRSNGKLSIKVLDDPQLETPVATLTRNSIASGGLQISERGSPFAEVILRFDENPTVMGSADLYEALGTEDPEAAAFARLQWRRVIRRSPNVKLVWKDAGAYEVNTRFTERADATIEKNRFANLNRQPDQGFRFHCRPQSVELDFGDVVILHLQTLDQYGAEVDRLGTHDDARFYVIGISDHELGGYTLDLWRPRVA